VGSFYILSIALILPKQWAKIPGFSMVDGWRFDHEGHEGHEENR
jgi:hypothetical protein